MAFPTMLFNSSSGSDTLASGAGPGTAITGSAGRSVSPGISIGFYGATDDFSGVATDGSAVVFVNVSTAGQRNFSAISTVKNTRQTGSDGAITTGTAILTVGSTTGWATNDAIKVSGAGAAGAALYSTVLTVDSPTQATLNNNAGTTVGPSAAWENPKQVLTPLGQGIVTTVADTAWAIGGKRQTLFGTNSLKLFTNNSSSGDAMEGWILQMESGYTETRASTVDVRRNMTSTIGCGTLQGEPGAGTLPILTFSNNGNAIVMRGTYWVLQDFEMRNTNGTKTASVALIGAGTGTMVTVTRVVVSHSDNFWKAITPSNSGWYVRDCNIGFCAATGIETMGLNNRVVGSWIHDCTSHGINNASSTTLNLFFAYNLVETNGGDGFHFTDTGGVGLGGGYMFVGNTIAYNTGDGIEFTQNLGTTDRPMEQMIVLNNIFANNGGCGLNLSGTGWTDATFAAMEIDCTYNDFFTNSGGALVGSGSALTLPATNSTLDPQFVDQANANYAIGSNLAGLGWPGTRNVGANQSSTLSYLDIGVAQRQNSGTGGVLLYAVE